MDLKTLSESQLRVKLEEHRLKIKELEKKANCERVICNEIFFELQSRDELNVERVIDNMLAQLEQYKSEIDIISFTKLQRDLTTVKEPRSNSRIWNSHPNRFYKIGNIIKNIYFDLDGIISMRIRNSKIMKKSNLTNSRFTLKFGFEDKDNIIRSINSNIFSVGKDRAYSFDIEKQDIRQLSKSLNKNLKTKYIDYKDIIPDVIKLVKFIESDFESILLGYYLSIN